MAMPDTLQCIAQMITNPATGEVNGPPASGVRHKNSTPPESCCPSGEDVPCIYIILSWKKRPNYNKVVSESLSIQWKLLFCPSLPCRSTYAPICQVRTVPVLTFGLNFTDENGLSRSWVVVEHGYPGVFQVGVTVAGGQMTPVLTLLPFGLCFMSEAFKCLEPD